MPGEMVEAVALAADHIRMRGRSLRAPRCRRAPDATDHLEIGAGVQGLWGHNMRRADDQNVATGQPAKKLVLVPARTGDDLDAFATEQLQALEGDDSLVLAHSTAPTGK